MKAEIRNAVLISRNAVITSADIDIERALTYWLTLDYGGSCQGFGGYALGGDFGCEAIKRLLQTVGVEKWSELRGRPVRVKTEPFGKIYAIGHFIEDKWLDLEALAEEMGLRPKKSVTVTTTEATQ